MTQFKIESKQKKSTLLILILGGVACMLVCGFLIKNALSDDYLDLIYLLLGLLFGIFGITCFIGLYLADNLIIENRKLKIYAQTGRLKNEILIDNIENYIEVEKESRYTKWKDLTIYTKNSNYTISSYACPNYHQLRKVLTKGKKKNFYAEKIMYYKTHRRYGAGFLIFGTIFMLVFGNIFMQKDLDIRQNQLIQIQGTVSNNIKIKRSGKRNGDRSIEIILMEYPKFQFKIGGYGFSATKISDLIHNIQKGDQIKIEVLEEQFQKKNSQRSSNDIFG